MNKHIIIVFILFVNSVLITQNNFSQTTDLTDRKSGYNIEDMDMSVDPNVNFYEYSNGTWLKNNPIPPEYSRWGSWNIIIERNQETLRNILEKAAVKSNPENKEGTLKQKLGDLYFIAMDTITIEKEGMNPVKQDLAVIDAINSKEDFIKVFSYMKTFRNGGIMSLYAGQDDKNSSNVILNIYPGGLGLPERDYYLNESGKSKELRTKYKDFMVKMFELLGYDNSNALKQVQNVYDIENRFAKASMTREESSEAENVYHLLTYDELKSLTPDFTWEVLFKELGLEDKTLFDKGIIVTQPEYMKEMNRMISEVSIEEWKSYLRWNLIRSAADKLSSPFADESFNFYSKTMRGTKKMLPRWKIGIQFVESAMGEPLGQLFVENNFTPETKAKAMEMVNNIILAFEERLKNNEWMSDATKKEALLKLSKFTVKIGYPEKWKDYSGLEISRSSLYENLKNASKFSVKYNLNKIGKPVDKKEWSTNPQVVNAYYSSSKNEIVFPAGIMQPPFFDPESDYALNYGAIGSVIGHEITHGFDDQGRKYDGDGNMKDWWTAEDQKNYISRTDKLVEQYDGYFVEDSLHVNGRYTLGENIADLGGVLISFDALEKQLQGKEQSPIDGFTQQQRFFLAYSRLWRINSRPEVLRLLVNTDSHSPEIFRVNGTVVNVTEFMKAFNGKEGDPMTNSADKRVVIW